MDTKPELQAVQEHAEEDRVVCGGGSTAGSCR